MKGLVVKPKLRHCEGTLPSGKSCPVAQKCLRHMTPPSFTETRRAKPREDLKCLVSGKPVEKFQWKPTNQNLGDNT